MRRIALAVSFIAVCVPPSLAQDFSRVQLRQNVSVKKDVAKPAFITATFPEEGGATHEIGIGILADLTPKSVSTLLMVDALVDYQRNTVIDKPQDMLKVGASGEWQLNAIDPTAPGARFDSGLISFRANFANDRIKDKRGVQEAIYYTHVFVGRHQFPLPNDPFRFCECLEMEYSPTIGVEVDHVLDASDVSSEISTARLMTQANVAFYPAPVTADLRVELLVGAAWRYDMHNGGDTSKRHPLFTFGGNYYPLKTKRAQLGFGVSFVRGDDPDEGFEHQQYWQVGLKARLK